MIFIWKKLQRTHFVNTYVYTVAFTIQQKLIFYHERYEIPKYFIWMKIYQWMYRFLWMARQTMLAINNVKDQL